MMKNKEKNEIKRMMIRNNNIYLMQTIFFWNKKNKLKKKFPLFCGYFFKNKIYRRNGKIKKKYNFKKDKHLFSNILWDFCEVYF